MRRLGPRGELRTLKRFIGEVEGQFLTQHLSASELGPPKRQEMLDVAAYVVLTHGAFENFVEGLSLWALEKVEQSWMNRRRSTRCTASLLLYRKAPSNEMAAGVSVFDNVRVELEEAKSEAARRIGENNGITPRHLRSLFRPLGIDVPEDPVLIGSLELLVSLRHQWAHQYRFGASVLKPARDVKRMVGDCVALAERLSVEVEETRP